MRNSAKFGRTVSAPRPDDLAKFLDNPPPSNQKFSNFGDGGPPFRPVTTLRGGSGGGFGTGGGFGSTGGFHTMRLAPWEEKSVVPLDPNAPPIVEQTMPKDRPSQWAPSVCAAAVAHSVNKLRAERDGGENLRAVVDESLVAPPIQPSDGGPMLIMQPERFALMHVSVPPPHRVLPPPNYGQPADALWTPEERRTLLEFEKAKRLADTVLGRDRQRQMRLIALMQRRHPNGVVGVECPATEGTVVYAAPRRAAALAAEAARERRERRTEWVVRNGCSAPHLGYDFLRQVPEGFAPPAGAPDQALAIGRAGNSRTELWQSKRHFPGQGAATGRGEAGGGAGAAEAETLPAAVGDHRGVLTCRRQPERTQRLRNIETDGRPYDIITALPLAAVPPSLPERAAVAAPSADCCRRMHPSLNPGSEPAHVTWVGS